MYGRADGMPSFQLTVAVCAQFVNLLQYNRRQKVYRLCSFESLPEEQPGWLRRFLLPTSRVFFED
jgi:hypothetical protein